MSLEDFYESGLRVNVWRHAWSCSNAPKHENIANYSNREPDPSITLWGTIGTLYQSYINHQYFATSMETPGEFLYVNVSVLLRTWFTAILLYGPNLQERERALVLIVSPFLRENVGPVGGEYVDGFNLEELEPSGTFNDVKYKIYIFIKSLLHIDNALDRFKPGKFKDILKERINKLKGKRIIIHNAYTRQRYDFTINNVFDSIANPYTTLPIQEGEITNITKILTLFSQQAPRPKRKELIVGTDKKTHTIYHSSVIGTKNKSIQYFGTGDIVNCLRELLYSIKQYKTGESFDDDIFDDSYFNYIITNRKVNIVCHGMIMEHFGYESLGINKRDQRLNESNTWGLDLELSFQKYDQDEISKNRTKFKYPDTVGYIKGINSPEGKINIECEYSCVFAQPWDTTARDRMMKKCLDDDNTPGPKRDKFSIPDYRPRQHHRAEHREGEHKKPDDRAKHRKGEDKKPDDRAEDESLEALFPRAVLMGKATKVVDGPKKETTLEFATKAQFGIPEKSRDELILRNRDKEMERQRTPVFGKKPEGPFIPKPHGFGFFGGGRKTKKNNIKYRKTVKKNN